MKTKEAYAACAKANHDQGYNCAQSVFLAFAEDMGLPVDQAAHLLQGLGGGLGGLGEACGALLGATAAFSMLSQPLPMGDPAAKMAYNAKVKALGEAFRAATGGTRCPELKVDDPEEKKRLCGGYVATAAKLVVEALEQ